MSFCFYDNAEHPTASCGRDPGERLEQELRLGRPSTSLSLARRGGRACRQAGMVSLLSLGLLTENHYPAECLIFRWH